MPVQTMLSAMSTLKFWRASIGSHLVALQRGVPGNERELHDTLSRVKGLGTHLPRSAQASSVELSVTRTSMDSTGTYKVDMT